MRDTSTDMDRKWLLETGTKTEEEAAMMRSRARSSGQKKRKEGIE